MKMARTMLIARETGREREGRRRFRKMEGVEWEENGEGSCEEDSGRGLDRERAGAEPVAFADDQRGKLELILEISRTLESDARGVLGLR